MAKLDRPLYGEHATGVFDRVLAFRRVLNPPDAPGDPVVTFGSVASLPRSSCPPSPAQIQRRLHYAAAVAAWNALTDAEKSAWLVNKPANLTGLNFFIRLFLSPGLAYFYMCIFGEAIFQLSPGPGQPAAADYPSLFPDALDELPTLRDFKDSPQAWLFNKAYGTINTIQEFLILNKSTVEGM